MLKRIISLSTACCLLFAGLAPASWAMSQEILPAVKPGQMVPLSPVFEPAKLIGLKIHPDNPFLFDFILDQGDDHIAGPALKEQGNNLIKYFLAGLAVPEEELWVNLSPYEHQRVIPKTLGQTDMGRNLLAQDYLLKQVAASLIYPQSGLGKDFWDRVYAQVHDKFGPQATVPLNLFNKVWIMGDKAEVYVRHNTVFVTTCHLKVMLDEDYLAYNKSNESLKSFKSATAKQPARYLEKLTEVSQVMREVILPALEREVNEGKNFATLRQIFYSLVLAGWYKNNLKASLLNQLYADKQAVAGIAADNISANQRIYEQYLQAYRKGVFNLVKEERFPGGGSLPRKYFSGGVVAGAAMHPYVNAAMSSRDFSVRIALKAVIILSTLLVAGKKIAKFLFADLGGPVFDDDDADAAATATDAEINVVTRALKAALNQAGASPELLNALFLPAMGRKWGYLLSGYYTARDVLDGIPLQAKDMQIYARLIQTIDLLRGEFLKKQAVLAALTRMSMYRPIFDGDSKNILRTEIDAFLVLSQLSPDREGVEQLKRTIVVSLRHALPTVSPEILSGLLSRARELYLDNPAMAASGQVINGGIDLNQAHWQWQLRGDRAQIHVNPKALLHLKQEDVESLAPYILKITPINNLMNI